MKVLTIFLIFGHISGYYLNHFIPFCQKYSNNKIRKYNQLSYKDNYQPKIINSDQLTLDLDHQYHIINYSFKNKQFITCEPGGLNGFYSMGVAYFLHQHYNLSQYYFAGASAGSWVCLILSLKSDLNYIIQDILSINLTEYKGKNYQKFYHLQNKLQNIIINNFEESDFNLSKVYIGVSLFKKFGFEGHLITNFNNLTDVTNCCQVSSHIPLITGDFFKTYNQHLAVDGGLNNLPLSLIPDPYFNINSEIWGRQLEGGFNPNKNLTQLLEWGYLDSLKNKNILDQIFNKKKKNSQVMLPPSGTPFEWLTNCNSNFVFFRQYLKKDIFLMRQLVTN